MQHRLINKLFWGTLIQTIAAASYFLEAATTFQKQKKFTVDIFWLLLEKLGSDIILAYYKLGVSVAIIKLNTCLSLSVICGESCLQIRMLQKL